MSDCWVVVAMVWAAVYGLAAATALVLLTLFSLGWRLAFG